ncbi:MAG: Gfo/Idh/MocA family oxidoreductase [Desulfovibrio sp.]|jgi:predicted dehydrogenase|nr:Gfo/Idh/MocA family oxidoreductase [Desulfovibrio sp.]
MSGHSCKVAVVGAGYMAREHIRAFGDIPGVTVAGILSRTSARAEALAAEFGVACIGESMRGLYEATRADLLVIAVPELAAFSVIRAALDHPWTILAEKPVGYCQEEAEAICALVEAQGRRLYVALNRRFYGATLAAARDLAQRSGPRFIEVLDQQDQAAALAASQPERVVRNWMYANSIHLVDYFLQFGRGEIVGVDAVLPWKPHSPGHVAALLRFSGGDVGYYHAVWNGPGPWACFVSTPETRWELRPLEQARRQMRGERMLTEQEAEPWDAAFKPGLRRQAEEAVKTALGLPSLSVPLAEANKTMRLIRSIYEQRAGL